MRIYQPPNVAVASCRRVLLAKRRQDAAATVCSHLLLDLVMLSLGMGSMLLVDHAVRPTIVS